MNNPQRQANDLSSLRFAIGYANMMPNVVAKLTETRGCRLEFCRRAPAQMSDLLAPISKFTTRT